VNVLLWVLQVVLALIFLMAGGLKLAMSKEKARERLAWVEDFSEPTLKLIGAMEVLGALGLVLPAATGIAPVLTPLAAVGLAVLMVAAAVVHTRRREYGSVALNAVLFAVAVVVAWGRFGPYHL
jgi:uncharacterized membrane protein YphA (DoxX/SURF4 family)